MIPRPAAAVLALVGGGLLACGALELPVGMPGAESPGGEPSIEPPRLSPVATYTPATLPTPFAPTSTPLATVIITLQAPTAPAAPTEPVLPPPTASPAPTSPTATTVPPSPSPVAAATSEPLQGGTWDMEAGFDLWQSPYGEPCPGGALATGWSAFVVEGEFGSSCLNENRFPPNNHSGERSQELTFDFIAAQAGIYRTIETQPGHRYEVVAWGKHAASPAPMELSIGVDLTGGQRHDSPEVSWQPWSRPEPDVWHPGRTTVTASGDRMTIFLRGRHPEPVAGGATVFDDVRVLDLGPAP